MANGKLSLLAMHKNLVSEEDKVYFLTLDEKNFPREKWLELYILCGWFLKLFVCPGPCVTLLFPWVMQSTQVSKMVWIAKDKNGKNWGSPTDDRGIHKRRTRPTEVVQSGTGRWTGEKEVDQVRRSSWAWIFLGLLSDRLIETISSTV